MASPFAPFRSFLRRPPHFGRACQAGAFVELGVPSDVSAVAQSSTTASVRGCRCSLGSSSCLGGRSSHKTCCLRGTSGLPLFLVASSPRLFASPPMPSSTRSPLVAPTSLFGSARQLLLRRCCSSAALPVSPSRRPVCAPGRQTILALRRPRLSEPCHCTLPRRGRGPGTIFSPLCPDPRPGWLCSRPFGLLCASWLSTVLHPPILPFSLRCVCTSCLSMLCILPAVW